MDFISLSCIEPVGDVKEERTRGGIWRGDSGDKLLVQRSISTQDFVMSSYHMHRTFELNFTVSGHTELQSCTHTVQLRGPFVAIHRPYIPHRMRMTDGEKPYFRFIFNLPDDYLAQVSSWIPAVSPMFEHTLFAFELTEEQKELLLSRAEEAFRFYKKKRYDIARPAIAMFLAELSDIFPNVRIMAASSDIRYLEEVLQYLIAHISERLICSEVAARFFISESKLSHDFKKCFGLAFNQYVMQLRVKMAKDLLSYGASVMDAAKACGFCSSSYFITIFKSYTGMTPGEYILGLQNE